MSIRVVLNHRTTYLYERPILLGPQTIRLRPAPHCRTRICNYSLEIHPEKHFENWLQDPFGNHLARCVFPDPTDRLDVSVDLTVEMKVINPFDFFVEEYAEDFPFEYEEQLKGDLRPFLDVRERGPRLLDYLKSLDLSPRRSIQLLVDLNQQLQRDVQYLIRMEPGVQTCEETLANQSGSCRDSAWLFMQVLRHCGFATRFVSGYLIQLAPDIKPLDGPAGPEKDFTDLHAWAEVFLPGAGWVGLDPTSGLLAGEGHIPLACAPLPTSAAPIEGGHEKSEVKFGFEMQVERVHETPRVTKPYTDRQWQQILTAGEQIDVRLEEGDVRLTMGGEPTFVSVDNMEGDEWTVAAVGPEKYRLSRQLIHRLQSRFAPGSLLHIGQGKWYPGEPLPRWAMTCLWRKDGEPIWNNDKLVSSLDSPPQSTLRDAAQFVASLCENIGIENRYVRPAYEDIWNLIQAEQKLPVDVNPRDFDLEQGEERARLARALERGVSEPVGFVLPLKRPWWQANSKWQSGPWPFRGPRLFLIPGDSPVGLRLPLESLPVARPTDDSHLSLHQIDPFAPRNAQLPRYIELRNAVDQTRLQVDESVPRMQSRPSRLPQRPGSQESMLPDERESRDSEAQKDSLEEASMVRTALCIEPRNGLIHVFMPPVGTLEDYLELTAAIEATTEELNVPVVLEGYLPPFDPRIEQVKVTPDPGVIEVNVQPATSWHELVSVTTGIYDDAQHCRLGTEKFHLDGRHSGTGGGNHVVLGGPTPEDSPFLRRPDLLGSLLTYWNNHPSLSYLFSGLFIGPTSQAPRVDEGRQDAVYELQIAIDQIQKNPDPPPWLVDRLFRHLLTDLTGNTHRAEFCIDKLFSPDSSTGRLGLLEFRAFEMPPHARMSLTQQLLLRALVVKFWERPCEERLVRWESRLHDQFMLPHFLEVDFRQVIRELQTMGLMLQPEWFTPHLEFRCPLIGVVEYDNIQLELRQAIEPWYVLGEQATSGGTTRYVDSSVERLQVKVTGLSTDRYAISCQGRKIPLAKTEAQGVMVGGVRYRAWQPPSCLHPTIPVHVPLVFDIVDLWEQRSIGGCRYHIDNAGGMNPSTLPVNALEAESRRACRFFRFGHTQGHFAMIEDETNPVFPMTLDLRRG